MYKNAANLDNTQQAIYLNGYNNITNEKKKNKRWIKNIILVIYFLKVINKINGTKRMKKSNSETEVTIAERVKLRRQKESYEDLSDMPPLESDEEVKEERD